MPIFYFHVENGHRALDEDGTDLADVAAARLEGARVLGDLLQDRPSELFETGNLRLRVADQSGLDLFVLDLSATAAPAGFTGGR